MSGDPDRHVFGQRKTDHIGHAAHAVAVLKQESLAVDDEKFATSERCRRHRGRVYPDVAITNAAELFEAGVGDVGWQRLRAVDDYRNLVEAGVGWIGERRERPT